MSVEGKQQPNVRYTMLQSSDSVTSGLDAFNNSIATDNLNTLSGAFTFYDTKLPVFETVGVQCNICFSDLYILWDCFDYTGLPINYRGYRVKPFRARATSAEHHSAVCKCGNCGIIKDSDNDLHVYVDDIRTVILCNYYIRTSPNTLGNYDLIHKEKIGRSEEFLYVDYSQIKHTGHSSKAKYIAPLAKPKDNVGVFSSKRGSGSLNLMKALDNYTDFHANKWHTLPGIAK